MFIFIKTIFQDISVNSGHKFNYAIDLFFNILDHEVDAFANNFAAIYLTVTQYQLSVCYVCPPFCPCPLNFIYSASFSKGSPQLNQLLLNCFLGFECNMFLSAFFSPILNYTKYFCIDKHFLVIRFILCSSTSSTRPLLYFV